MKDTAANPLDIPQIPSIHADSTRTLDELYSPMVQAETAREPGVPGFDQLQPTSSITSKVGSSSSSCTSGCQELLAIMEPMSFLGAGRGARIARFVMESLAENRPCGMLMQICTSRIFKAQVRSPKTLIPYDPPQNDTGYFLMHISSRHSENDKNNCVTRPDTHLERSARHPTYQPPVDHCSWIGTQYLEP